MDVLQGVRLEAGRPYKATDVWKQLHARARAPGASPLLVELAGAPMPLPTDRVFPGETRRLATARKHAAAANVDVLAETAQRLYGAVQSQAFAAVCACLRGARGEGAPASAPAAQSAPATEAPNMLPAVLLFGGLHTADNSVYLEKLEVLLLKRL
jgi:hypothetical protein